MDTVTDFPKERLQLRRRRDVIGPATIIVLPGSDTNTVTSSHNDVAALEMSGAVEALPPAARTGTALVAVSPRTVSLANEREAAVHDLYWSHLKLSRAVRMLIEETNGLSRNITTFKEVLVELEECIPKLR